MMKTATLVCSALLLVLATGCDEFVSKDQVEPIKAEVVKLRKELDDAKATQGGRWRIEMRAGVRADTYLIDTGTGRVWREYEGAESKMVWRESPRIDRPWLAGNGMPGQYSPEVEQLLGKWIAAGWSRPNAINQLKRIGILGDEAPEQSATNPTTPK